MTSADPTQPLASHTDGETAGEQVVRAEKEAVAVQRVKVA